jgi:hypothetical protein
MKVKFITYDTCFGNGAQTLAQNTLHHMTGNSNQGMIVIAPVEKKSTPEKTEKAKERRREKVRALFGKGVDVACDDDDVIELCKDVDALFVLMFINGVWPTFKECLDRIPVPKVIFSLGTQESRVCGDFYKRGSWDAWWSERPLIRDFNIKKGFVSKDTPYIVGCNVYDLTCPLTPQEAAERRNPQSLITNARWTTSKGAVPLLEMFNKLQLESPNLQMDAWGWKSNEGGISFFSMVKSVPERWEAWSRVSKLARGTYSRKDIPHILGGLEKGTAPRFAVDLTNYKGDGTIWGDGGLQYCQAEALDWGSVPVVDRGFHQGDAWDKVLLRVPDSCLNEKAVTKGPALAAWLQKEILPQWNVDEHAERIHLGRQYIKENLSLTRFNSSIDEIIEKLKVR